MNTCPFIQTSYELISADGDLIGVRVGDCQLADFVVVELDQTLASHEVS